ncbi:MAG: hypothetical protein H7A51_13110 [Akkermansiaceae bacterium]|nr:hypothetical protein [Akkermansiaceae bacterium]
MKRILTATLAGAVAAFAWGFVSWVLLPWHQMADFKDDAAVAKVITENAPAHGLYVLPKQVDGKPDPKAITDGPFVYAVVRPGKLAAPWSETTALIGSFCIQLAGALIITIAIHRIRATRYISRASVGPAMGLFAGTTVALPTWNWFELPDTHTLAQVLDPLIAWTIAGLIIASMIKPPKRRRIFS